MPPREAGTKKERQVKVKDQSKKKYMKKNKIEEHGGKGSDTGKPVSVVGLIGGDEEFLVLWKNRRTEHSP